MLRQIPSLENVFNSKYPSIIVVTLHLVITVYRCYLLAMEIISLESDININQLIYIVMIVLLQIFVILFLLIGAITNKPKLLLPWLCFTAPVLVMATSYVSLYIPVGDNIQNFINFIVVGLFWISWYMVFKFYLYLKEKRMGFHCNYSKLSEIHKEAEKYRIIEKKKCFA